MQNFKFAHKLVISLVLSDVILQSQATFTDVLNVFTATIVSTEKKEKKKEFEKQ